MFIIDENNVKESLDMTDAVEVIEDALIKYDKGEYKQPSRTFSQINDENNLLLMPCFVDDCIGLKVVTSFPSNRNSEENIPVTQGMILINDIKNGIPLSMINGTITTAIKTGAVSGVAMKHFKNDAKTVGLVGTGLQGIYQLMAAIATTSVETIYLYNRTPEKMTSFIKDFKALANSDVILVPVFDIKELITKSEIIITATTSLKPVLPDEEIYDDKLIVAVGSYKENMRELPEKLFKSTTNYYIDSYDGRYESGDIIDPLKHNWIKEENLVLLSDIVAGNKEMSKDSSEPLVFKSVSMALFDAAIGNYVYKTAKSKGEGTEVSF